MPEGRQSPPPEQQSGRQQQDPPASGHGVNKTDDKDPKDQLKVRCLEALRYDHDTNSCRTSNQTPRVSPRMSSRRSSPRPRNSQFFRMNNFERSIANALQNK